MKERYGKETLDVKSLNLSGMRKLRTILVVGLGLRKSGLVNQHLVKIVAMKIVTYM